MYNGFVDQLPKSIHHKMTQLSNSTRKIRITLETELAAQNLYDSLSERFQRVEIRGNQVVIVEYYWNLVEDIWYAICSPEVNCPDRLLSIHLEKMVDDCLFDRESSVDRIDIEQEQANLQPEHSLTKNLTQKSSYRLMQAEKSFCPNCNSNVHLLMSDAATRTPTFFICFACEFIGEVGVGRVVPTDDTEEEEEKKEEIIHAHVQFKAFLENSWHISSFLMPDGNFRVDIRDVSVILGYTYEVNNFPKSFYLDQFKKAGRIQLITTPRRAETINLSDFVWLIYFEASKGNECAKLIGSKISLGKLILFFQNAFAPYLKQA
jgi:hypothetical protein